MNPMQLMNSPLFKRAQQMSKGKNVSQMEETCRNICEQKGLDFDQMKNMFGSQMNQTSGMFRGMMPR